MNRSPGEILVNIFKQLVLKDKLQCALTCRNWHFTISGTVLYSKISFRYRQRHIQTKALVKFMHDQGLGHQVLDLNIVDMHDPLELSELYPNLKLLQVNGWKDKNWDDSNNAVLVQNWKKLEAIYEVRSYYKSDDDDDDGEEEDSYTLFTMKMLSASSYMMSLTALTIGTLFNPEYERTFIEQLKHAPMLERLTLQHTSNVGHIVLDLVHKGTPNLKHLDIQNVRIILTYVDENMREFHSLSLDSFTVPTLQSLKLAFEISPDIERFRVERETNCLHWIEYICYKYPNLTSISIENFPKFKSQHNIDTMMDYLHRALHNWTRLKQLNMTPVYLSASLLQIMDDCGVQLEELQVYVCNYADMGQFANLAQSKQRNSIRELIINDRNRTWFNQELLDYFLQSLDKTKCQLQSIDILGEYTVVADNKYIVSPKQVLRRVPSLQRLSMGCDSMKDLFYTTYNQTTHLRHVNLVLYDMYNEKVMEHSAQQHIQDILYASPHLQSFSLFTYFENHPDIFDLQQNTKLKSIEYYPLYGDDIGIIQNGQKKWYTYCESEINPEENALQEIEPQKDDSTCRVILHLPPTIPSLFIHDIEFPL